jgi:uncharacterized protein
MNVTAESPSTNESAVTIVRHAIDHAAHYLPSQGPIAVFVHHNTLHAFESMRFEDAVEAGYTKYGSQPYWPEVRYRKEYARGRITDKDIDAVLLDDLRQHGLEEIAQGTTRFNLYQSLMKSPVLEGSDAELRWLTAQTDALDHFCHGVSDAVKSQMVDSMRHWTMRDLRTANAFRTGTESNTNDLKHSENGFAIFKQLEPFFPFSTIEDWSEATWQKWTLHFLWQECIRAGEATRSRRIAKQPYLRHRDRLLSAVSEDSDLIVHDLLIRFSAAMMDQGVATWQIPNRSEGFYRCFLTLFQDQVPWSERWMAPLAKIIRDEDLVSKSPLESIAHSLTVMGVPISDWDSYIERTLLALPGWSGMVDQMATNADWTLSPAKAGSLDEFLAVRLVLDRIAVRYIANNKLLGQKSFQDLLQLGSLNTIESPLASCRQRAFHLFQTAQKLGWDPKLLSQWSTSQWQTIVDELEHCDGVSRRRIFQLAYERNYRIQVLDAISEHTRGPLQVPAKVRLQVITCIDDREESFRRHLEEIDPMIETFGAPGFFAVPMYFRGAADAHFIPLCPVIIKPKNYVEEVGPLSAVQAELRRSQTRRLLGKASHGVHLSSRSLLSGTLTALLGSLSAFPLVARVLFPRLTSRIRSSFAGLVKPTIATRLELERIELTDVDDPTDDKPCTEGFTLDEMANAIQRLAGDLGIANKFARLVVVVGHGSSSLNNPHESAYNCGACGGGRGGPNARANAAMANDPRVRRILRERGLVIDDSTYFLGAYHNTCNDSITYFDLERIPQSHQSDFLAASKTITEAAKRNAHERSRRFESIELDCSFDEALNHVECRSEDLGQARPEYNHATNAVCIIARRGRTRGLFLDRRSFLNSYDPTTDDANASILTRIMQAAVPVCGGISLEYYFSTVDSSGYGCGSKLPHNITSLIGVMEGAASDLRTGLSQQMVEIHEPVRILFVVETQPEVILSIMSKNPLIDTYIRNEWVQIATLDPNSPNIQVFTQSGFHPYTPSEATLPNSETSLDWYRGWREHLGFARIESGMVRQEVNS